MTGKKPGSGSKRSSDLTIACDSRWLVVPAAAVILLLAASCNRSDQLATECTQATVNAQYEDQLHACRAAFLKSDDSDALSGFMNAAAELDDIPAIDRMLVLAGHHPALGNSLIDAARIFARREQTESANLCYQRAYETYTRQGEYTALARMLLERHRVAWRKSMHREAIHFALESLDIATQASDSKGEIAALNALFNVFEEVGALGAARNSLALIETRLPEGVSGSRINYHNSRGLLEMDRGNFGLAAHEFDTALTLAHGSKNRAGLRGLHLNLVNANLHLERFDVAENHLKLAWDNAETDGSGRYALLFFSGLLGLKTGDTSGARQNFEAGLATPDLPSIWSWELHYNSGLAAQASGDVATANVSYLSAIEALELLREEISYDDMKSHLLAKRRQPYEAMLQNLAVANDSKAAINIIERSKARAFVDSLVSSGTLASASPNTNTEFREVADRLDSLRNYLAAMRSSNSAKIDPIESLLDPLYDDVVVVHFLSSRRLWVATIHNGRISLVPSPLNASQLQALVSKYLDNPDDLVTLSNLGDELFPSTVRPEAGAHVYVVPDNYLQQIALPSVIVGGEFLIERNTISLVPSLNALSEIRSSRGTDPRLARPVVLGDPHGDLPSARDEARTVAMALGVPALVGEDANVEQLGAATSNSVLHLATHSGTDYLGPWFDVADGKLSVEMPFWRSVDADLVFLASCNSAIFADQSLWGSLGGLFLSNGSTSVVASTSSVDDKLAKSLIVDFYSHYLDGNTVAASLGYAQTLALREQSGPRPSEWGAFVVLGEGAQRYAQPLH